VVAGVAFAREGDNIRFGEAAAALRYEEGVCSGVACLLLLPLPVLAVLGFSGIEVAAGYPSSEAGRPGVDRGVFCLDFRSLAAEAAAFAIWARLKSWNDTEALRDPPPWSSRILAGSA